MTVTAFWYAIKRLRGVEALNLRLAHRRHRELLGLADRLDAGGLSDAANTVRRHVARGVTLR